MEILLFTLIQSVLSTLLSMSLGFFLAWCLAWSPRFLSKTLKLFLTLPLLTPSIVILLGYISLFSSHGKLAGILPLYGLGGIVGAHTFFYTPFVTVFLWQAWIHIPCEQRLLVQQLKFSRLQSFHIIELPTLKPFLFTAFWLVFCMGLASFTTVLILGGGPQSTTLSVALYQNLFNNLDLPKALYFAFMQVGLCMFVYGFIHFSPQLKCQPSSQIQANPKSCPIATSLSLGLSIVILAPLWAIFIESFPIITTFFAETNLFALRKSFLIALCTGPLATSIAIVGLVCCSGYERIFSLMGSIFFIIPLPLFGFGAFWLQYQWESLPNFPVIIFLNTLLTLPFAIHFLRDPVAQIKANYSKIALSLGLTKLQRTRLIFLPLLIKPIGQALGFCSALAAGDLTALLMFPDYESPGLSSLLYQQMGGYRGGEAMGTACILLITCVLIIYSSQIIFKEPQYART